MEHDKVVGCVRFGMLDPKEIITEEAKREGLSDPRLGCPGHFGHIVLAQPFYHVLFTKTVFSVLESVCFRCSRIRVRTNFNHALTFNRPRKRLKMIQPQPQDHI
ncbi:hypothetical protein FF1_026865 [Malus domestica]